MSRKSPRKARKPIHSNKGRRFPPEVLEADEVMGLFNACSPRSMTGIRNRALIATLYRTGLRITEALSLYPKDISMNTGVVRVLHGKGDKARTVGIDNGAIECIQGWLDVRQKIEGHLFAPLFCTLTGRQINSSYIRQLLPRLAKRAGIQKRVHPHGLRHTHAAQPRSRE